MIRIGFAGLEAFDVVLYIGRTLTKLNKRVLIIDLSNSNALETAINHGMDIDSNFNIVNYRDINYTRMVPSENEINEFGVVIFSFGLECKSYELADKIILVCDILPSNIKKVKGILGNVYDKHDNVDMLIRNVINIEDVDRIVNLLDLKKNPANTSFHYYNLDDYESAVNCQVTQVIRFTNISKEMNSYIIQEIKSIFPDIKESVIKKAIYRARRGV